MKQKIRISNKYLLLLVFVIGISTNSTIAGKYSQQEALQQQIVVTGTVTDIDTQEPLPGVNVVIRGTTEGTITNPDGNYSIEAPADGTLVFSFIGYEIETIQIQGRQRIDVGMKSSLIALEEVVAIGYGTRDVTSLTGNVSRVEMDQVKRDPTGNIERALQGNVPGVQVIRGKTPGSGASVRIHGLGTIGNNSPLWVVDGVQVGAFNLSSAEIKSITVLKDAASIAVYGARGSNGVILVETTQGRKMQETSVTFSSRAGMQQQYRTIPMLGVDELGELRWMQQINSGIENPTDPLYNYGPNGEIGYYNYIMPSRTMQIDYDLYDRWFPWEDGTGILMITRSNPEGTDWLGAVTRSAPVHEHNLSISGGTDRTTFGIAAGYLNEEATIGEASFERFNLRVNSTIEFKDWLKVGENLHIVQRTNRGWQAEGTSGLVLQSLRIPKIIPIYDIDGYFSPVTNIAGTHGHNNPVAAIDHGRYIRNVNLAAMGNTFLEITPIRNLDFRSSFGFSLGNTHNRSPLPKTPEEITPRAFDQLSESFSRSNYWSWTNTLTYSGEIGDIHSYEILLGAEVMEGFSSSIGAQRQMFFQFTDDYMVMNAGELNQTNSGSVSDWASMGFFTRVHYELYNKYLFDVTLRHDGSSRFGREERWGTFPAAAFAWRISQEDFIRNVNWVNDLRLRASWGRSGNDRIGNYNGFTTFAGNIQLSYYPIQGQDNAVNPGLQSTAFGNPFTKWETTTHTSIGIDATVFNSLRMTFDFWNKNTTDMLYRKSIPFVYGVASWPSVNIGEMNNVGFDIGLNYSGSAMNGDLAYNFSLIGSRFKNEIISLSDEAGEFIGGPELRQMVYTRAEAGTTFPAFYGMVVDGIFQTQEEADAHPPAFGQYNRPGRFIFRDVNGDGVVNADDRTYIGSPHPDFTGSFSTSLAYKQFDMSFQFYGSYGNDIMNVERRLLDFNFFNTNRGLRRLYESWGSPYLADNRDAKMPIAEMSDSDSQRPSSYFIEDGSFLKLSHLEIGYTIASPAVNLRVYAIATDLFTITNYTGLDPEVGFEGMGGGVVEGGWAIPRRFMIGIVLDL